VYSIFLFETSGSCLLNLDHYQGPWIKPQNYLSEGRKMLIMFVVIELFLFQTDLAWHLKGHEALEID
jgi:hypothetical protein